LEVKKSLKKLTCPEKVIFMKIPVLSVVVTTYNHVNFLPNCLDSILCQEFEQDFEIIVGEDLSTDGTRQVLQQYHQKFPDKIKPLYHETNVGGHENFIRCIAAANSEWIAWLEGDDFWLDSLKIQKQYNLLINNKNAVICFSRAQSLDEEKIGFAPGRIFGPSVFKREYSRLDLLASNIIPTCTVVFNKYAAIPLPEWYKRWHLGDWTLYLKVLESGTAIFLNEVTAMYRVHAKGAWSTVPPIHKFEKQMDLINFLISIEKTQEGKKILHLNLFSQQVGLIASYIKQKMWKMIIPTFLKSLKSALKAKWQLDYIYHYSSRAKQLIKHLRR
jgi:glycosyltransferase involved in cell wall biosynthesis